MPCRGNTAGTLTVEASTVALIEWIDGAQRTAASASLRVGTPQPPFHCSKTKEPWEHSERSVGGLDRPAELVAQAHAHGIKAKPRCVESPIASPRRAIRTKNARSNYYRKHARRTGKVVVQVFGS